MSSKRLNESVSELHKLVSNLDKRDAVVEGFVEELSLEQDSSVQPATSPVVTSFPQQAQPATAAKLAAPPRQSATSVPRPKALKDFLDLVAELRSPNGDLSRAPYAKRIGVGVLLTAVINGFVQNGEISGFWLFIFAMFAGWVAVTSSIKRVRNIGLNPWWLITVFIPYLNIVVLAILFLAPQKKTP